MPNFTSRDRESNIEVRGLQPFVYIAKQGVYDRQKHVEKQETKQNTVCEHWSMRVPSAS